MRTYCLSLALIIGSFAVAQSPFKLHLTPKVATQTFALKEVVTNTTNVKISIDYFNYYVSNLHIFHDGGQDLDLSDSVYLVKHDNYILDLGMLNISNVEKIKFGVGVNLSLSHSDISQYPTDHPLSFQDPSMQWGWSSGYNQMIVGGNADSNQDDVPDVYFEIHPLGDGNFREIEVLSNAITNANNEQEILINCNLDEWFGTIDLGTTGIKHGETGVNFVIMKNITNRPVFTSSVSANVIQNSNEIGELISYKENDKTKLKWKDLTNLDSFVLVDSNGKLVYSAKISGVEGEIILPSQKTGIYFGEMKSKNKEQVAKLKVIF